MANIQINYYNGSAYEVLYPEAYSATKLATQRSIRTNLSSTSYGYFDGTANITPGIYGTLPVSYGGTGVTSLSSLASNLGPYMSSSGPRIQSSTYSGTGSSLSITLSSFSSTYLGMIVSQDNPSTVAVLGNNYWENVIMQSTSWSAPGYGVGIDRSSLYCSNSSYYSKINGSGISYRYIVFGI